MTVPEGPRAPGEDAASEAEKPQAPTDDGVKPAETAGEPEASQEDRVDVLADEAARQLEADGTPTEQPLAELRDRIKTLVIGKPRDLADSSMFHRLSLVAFLAWVGLGADGLSSSSYGPAEAFHSLGEHSYLAVFLALATIVTVAVISACYSHIIEEFPSGGGGYVVASKLLGNQLGVVAGCALLVDYVLTITVSIAAAGDALFGLIDPSWLPWKLWTEVAAVVLLIMLNIRGIRESVLVMLPIFLLFLITHAILIGGVAIVNIGRVDDVARDVSGGIREGMSTLGFFVMANMFLRAYSLGAGTYTGIEAVSNSMSVMREPRVATGKRTMLYMAISLSLTAAGLILGYLLMGIFPVNDKTMNQLLTESFLTELHLDGSIIATVFLLATMFSEGAMLVAAAQAGFIGGPRMLASMAFDSWTPHWFANLSERLTTHNGILLMGLAALAALWHTRGDVDLLVIMYSINVFLTFSLSMLGMTRYWYARRKRHPLAPRRLALFICGAVLCVVILTITTVEKFEAGGWVTLSVTLSCVGICLATRRYYRRVSLRLRKLDDSLGHLETPDAAPNLQPPDPSKATAAILVGGYSGLGIHTLLKSMQFAPKYFKNVVFLSVAVLDSGNFKGAEAVDDLTRHSEEELAKYVELAQRLQLPSTSYLSIGTDVVDELERLCLRIMKDFPHATIFAGQLVFQRDTWYQRLLHNQTAYALQRRLQWAGIPMVILPTRVR